MHLKRIVDSYKTWEWRQAKKIMAKIHDLNYFFWEATVRCNLDCRHCGSECTKNEKMTELSASRVIEVFEDIANNYKSKEIMVAVTGGEPLIREDLFQVLSKVYDLGFSWGMVTNGMLVNEQVVNNCIDTGMTTVAVSLDGLESSHNWLRNNDSSYSNAINALELFVNKGNLKIVEAITCINERNISQLDDMYSVLKSIGINRWRIISMFPLGRAEQNSELITNKSLLIKLFNFIKERRHNDRDLHITYSEEGYLGCEWEKEVRDDLFYCGAGINVAGLLCDGSFGACPSLSREWIQGHINDTSFSQVWETRYENMRNREWMRSEGCHKCKQWKNCQGSSLHLWDWQKGEAKVCHYRLLNTD
jgi:radical SAM enzyme (rSAM/lipoprotein system)